MANYKTNTGMQARQDLGLNESGGGNGEVEILEASILSFFITNLALLRSGWH